MTVGLASPWNPRGELNRFQRLHPLLRSRHVGDDDAAVGRDIEAAGLNDAPLFPSQDDDLSRRLARRVNGVHRVPAPVEHEVGSVARLLEVDRLLGAQD